MQLGTKRARCVSKLNAREEGVDKGASLGKEELRGETMSKTGERGVLRAPLEDDKKRRVGVERNGWLK